VLAVGAAADPLRERLAARARSYRVGDGMDPKTEMGPVISRPHRDKVVGYIEQGVEAGAELVVDGRPVAAQLPQGNFLGATLFDRVDAGMTIAQEEIFGPVLCMMRVPDLESALATMRKHPLANATSIFTTNGKSARQFRYNAHASMIGVNIGVAAPMAYFPFGGSKGSFFGDTKAHGTDAINFYTDKKVVISRWV